MAKGHEESPSKKRKALSKKTRFEVFKRDSFTCQYCGATPPSVILHVDHIVAIAEGGGNNIDNLVTSCEPCNLGKGARSLKDIPQSLKDKADDVSEREEQIKGYNKVMLAKAKRIEDEAWNIVAIIQGVEYAERYNSASFLSIKKFLEKLSYFDVADAAEIANAAGIYSDSRKFRYFCGVCWGKIRDKQDGTR